VDLRIYISPKYFDVWILLIKCLSTFNTEAFLLIKHNSRMTLVFLPVSALLAAQRVASHCSGMTLSITTVLQLVSRLRTVFGSPSPLRLALASPIYLQSAAKDAGDVQDVSGDHKDQRSQRSQKDRQDQVTGPASRPSFASSANDIFIRIIIYQKT